MFSWREMSRRFACTGVAVPLRVVPSPTGLPSKRGPGLGSFSRADRGIGGLYSGYLTLLPDIQCDMAYAVNGYTNTFGDIWRWEILATNSQIEAVYGSLYSLIGNCNFLLDNAAKLKPTLTSDTELDRLELYCGEAYFARALAYSELIKLYCVDYKSDEAAKNELGVVLKTKYYEDQPIKRASLYDSYQQVLSDLDKAAEYLKLDEDYDPAVDGYLYNNSVYFNEYTVYALRARVALYMRDYQEAIKYSSKVIDSNMYFLSSANSQYSAGMNYYDYMWQYDLSSEVIWKVGFTSTNYGGALGTVFFNYDYTSFKPDYVPAKWVLDLYGSNDLRYNTFFYEAQTGYSHGLTWPLLYKYWGNQTRAFKHLPDVRREDSCSPLRLVSRLRGLNNYIAFVYVMRDNFKEKRYVRTCIRSVVYQRIIVSVFCE